MRYTFNTDKGSVNTWISFESYNDKVIIYDDRGNEVEESKLHNNQAGDLVFMYAGQEIPFRTFECMSMDELDSRIKSGEHIFEEEFVQAIIHDGMDNVRFAIEVPVADMFVPFMGVKVVGDKVQMCECKLVEEYLNMPHDKYKLKVQPVEGIEKGLCGKRYYVSAMISLIKEGYIKILNSVDDGKTPMEHIMEYFNSVTSKDYFNYKMPTFKDLM